jgi:hypothetical protein
MTETLAAFCTVLAWGLLVRFHFDRNWWNAALAGGAIGLAALCRPTYLPWLGVSALVAFFLHPSGAGRGIARGDWGFRLLNVAAMLVAGLGTMFPWGWRNYQAFQKPLLTTTHGGYTLYLANNKHFYRYLREDQSGLPWKPDTALTWQGSLQYRQSFNNENLNLLHGPNARLLPFSHVRELVIDEVQSEQAWKEIWQDPTGFARAAAYRVRQLWSPLPYKLTADESFARMLLRYLTATWYVAVYALALAGIWQLRWNLLKSPWLWGVLLCAIFTGVHVFYWCNLRMRAPLMPIVAVVAAAGALAVQKRIRPADDTADAPS